MKLKGLLKKNLIKKIIRVIITLLVIGVVGLVMYFASKNSPENMIANSIKFDQDSFTCVEGKVIVTNISGEVENATFSSLNNDIADIKKNEELIKPRCANCTVIDISCKKEGKTTVFVKANNGAQATTTIIVTKK